MSTLINKESGQAENVPDSALASGTHEVPLYSPDGKFGSAPMDAVPGLLRQGYTQPTAEQGSSLLKKAHYNTTGQQIITGLEGAAEGALGPLGLGIERLAGVDPEDIRGRAEENPITHGAGQLVGLAGPGLAVGAAVKGGALAAEGLAATVLGGQGALLDTVGAKAASALGGLPAEAAKLAVSNAVFQTGDEVSKMIKGNPRMSAETSLANIGLAAALGAGGGALFGAAGKAWDALLESKTAQEVSNFKNRVVDKLGNPDPVHSVTEELSNLHAGMKGLDKEVWGKTGLKAQDIEKVMPEFSDKMVNQANEISNKFDTAIAQDLKDSSPRVQAKLAKPAEQFKARLGEAKSAPEVFDAINDLKQSVQEIYSQKKMVSSLSEEHDLVNVAEKLRKDVKTALEDTSVWGKAGERQQSINKAFSEFQGPLKDFERKFTSKVNNEIVVDPGKVSTYLNQAGGAKGELKQDMLNNFIEASEKYKGALDATHANLGIDSPTIPLELTATKDSMSEKGWGTKLADSFIKHGLGKSLGGVTGAAIGSVVGHPGLGAIIGQHSLEGVYNTILPSFIKPLLEMDASGSAFRAAAKYAAAVAKGEVKLASATDAVLDGGTIDTSVHPELRKKLADKVNEVNQNPQQMFSLGSSVGHYLPDHASALAMTSSKAVRYLYTLRPNTDPLGPLDSKRRPSAAEQAKYDNALDIAQDPLSVLKSVQKGTLTATDVIHLQNMYPSLYNNMQSKLLGQIAAKHDAGASIPYKTRLSLSLFMAQPLDASMSPQSIQSAQISSINPPQQQSTEAPKLKNANKLDKLPNSAMTVQQSRVSNRAGRTPAH